MQNKNKSMIGAAETRYNYTDTKNKRALHKEKVYSVNIPFSKYSSTPVNQSQSLNHNSLETPKRAKSLAGFSKSQANMTPSSAYNEARLQIEQRQLIKAKIDTSSVTMKFPQNSPYVQNQILQFKPS